MMIPDTSFDMPGVIVHSNSVRQLPSVNYYLSHCLTTPDSISRMFFGYSSFALLRTTRTFSTRLSSASRTVISRSSQVTTHPGGA